MHLGCPVRYVEAAQRFICPCHGGVYDFRGMVAGGPPVRPLDRFFTRLNQDTTWSSSARGTRSTTSSSGSRRGSRVSRSTASASICTRPSSTPPRRRRSSPDAQDSRTAAAEGPPAQAEEAGRIQRPGPHPPRAARGRDLRRRLARRAHVAVGRPALADVAQGPARDQLGLHARLGDPVRVPQPGRHRRLPGDVLPPGRQRRGLRVRSATSTTTCSSASSCTPCTSGARR